LLTNAKVIINLDDLDKLRQKEKDYSRLLSDISKCVKFDFKKYENELERLNNIFLDVEQLDIAEEKARMLAVIKVDKEELEKILLNNCTENKTDNEMCLFETLADPELKYE